MMTRKQALFQLRLAQEHQEEAAIAAVIQWCWQRWGFTVRNFYSPDPAIDYDDIRSNFYVGAMKGIRDDKGLGDSLYYVARRGWWYVGSQLRGTHRHVQPTVLDDEGEVRADAEAWDPTADTEGFVIERIYMAERLETLLRIVPADSTASRCLQAMLDGDSGDPLEPGHNKRLAEVMGVSPQRASQAMAKLRDYADAD